VIEQILKKGERVFRYGQIMAVTDNKVQVRLGCEGAIWIKTQLSLEPGGAVIVARNSDSTWFVVQDAGKAVPSEKLLMNT
jgi:hypothetical protein